MRIQHNILAMNSYRNYSNNTSALGKNLEKLSSGYKINRAGDDAAGLAISEKMRAQITGLSAAQKNVKDGISLVKTAEGAMQEIQDMLNRMDYLATQSANGTYQDNVDREALQQEVDALREEINRIADSANFNGIKLLDGSLDSGKETVSLANGEDPTITVIADGQLAPKEPAAGKYSIDFSQATITNNTKNELPIIYNLSTGVGAVATKVKIAGEESLSGSELANTIMESLKETSIYDSTESVLKFTDNTTGNVTKFKMSVEGDKLVLTMTEPPKADFNQKMEASFDASMPEGTAQLSVTGEQLQVTPEVEAVAVTARAYGQASFDLDESEIVDGSAIKIGDETYVFAVGADSKYKDVANVIDLTDLKEVDSTNVNIAAQRLAQAAKDNKTFFVGTNLEDGVITVTEKEGAVDYSKNNLAGDDGKAALNGSGGTQDADAEDWAGLIQIGTAKISKTANGTALNLQIGDTSDAWNQMKISVGDMHTKAMGTAGGKSIADINIGTSEGAQEAVNVIKDAINYVSSVRGQLGAYQNRLEHTQNNLSVMAENIQDAESTIRDTDVAEEMMSYVKNNILVQSAQAMLAQANQVPQGVLQLLG